MGLWSGKLGGHNGRQARLRAILGRNCDKSLQTFICS
jgi:hypothetical protein